MDSSRKNTDSAGWFFGVETFLRHRERTWIGFLGLADVLDRKPDGANVLPPAVLLLSATPFVVIVVAVTVGVSTTIRSTAVSVSSIRSVAPSTILSTPVGPGVLFVITTVVPILVSFEGATTSITVILIASRIVGGKTRKNDRKQETGSFRRGQGKGGGGTVHKQ